MHLPNLIGGLAAFAIVPAMMFSVPAQTGAQVPARQQAPSSPAGGGPVVDSLVARALSASPALRAAHARIRAAEARVAPAAALPDPMLMVGVQNLPITDPGFSDVMTMKMIGVSQGIPRRVKLRAMARAAEHDVEAARLGAEAVALEVERDVRTAYYEVAYIDDALVIIDRTRDVLLSLVGATEARYEVGTTGQQDVIRARLEVTRLGDDASALIESRIAAVARLNAVLDQSTQVPLERATIPARIVSAGVATPAERIRFVAATLGSRAAGSPLPPLDAVQELAIRRNPELRMQVAAIAAQAARVELARLERRPDMDVTIQYGQRDGFADMLSAAVSIALPLQRGRKQNQLAVAEEQELAALEAEHHASVNDTRASLARLYTQLERTRTQLALIVKAMLPQSRAALESSVASYQSGRSEFVTVLDAQATLFNIETSYVRALSDFATTLAELERLAGGEVLP